MKDPMSDPAFAEFARLWPIRQDDAQSWAKRDRAVVEVLESEGSASERLQLQRRAGLLRENGFPEESLYGGLLSKPRDTVSLGHARTFSKLPARMLVLGGAPGTGKTTASAWLALRRDDEHPGFIRAGELERRGRYDKQLAAWLKERTSLVLDDLGVEIVDSKGVFISLLDEVIDAAYARRHIVVVTTNLAFEQLGPRYGARMMSRFQQVGIYASCGMHDLRRDLP